MSASDALRELAGFLDDLEAARSVESVEIAERSGPERGELRADVALAVGTDRGTVAVRDATVDGTGRLRLAVETGPLVARDHDVEVVDATTRVRTDGTLLVDLRVTASAGDENGDEDENGDREDVHDRSARRGDLDDPGDREAAGTEPAPDGDGGPGPADHGSRSVEGRDDGGLGGAGPGADADADANASADDEGRGDRGAGVPAFRDHERLAAAYESCSTFAEMREALGVEVTAETVRRYMIDAGVHQPASYDTGGSDDAADDGAPGEAGAGAGEAGESGETGEREADATGDGDGDDDGDGDGDDRGDGDGLGGAGDDGPGGRASGRAPGSIRATGGGPDEGAGGAGTGRDGEESVVLADGVGLPAGVTADALVDAVAAATTTYEVERRLDLDREEALAALRACDLLDLVAGRLGTAAEREVDRETVRERLRRAAGTRPR